MISFSEGLYPLTQNIMQAIKSMKTKTCNFPNKPLIKHSILGSDQYSILKHLVNLNNKA